MLGFLELPEEDVPDELIWHHPQLMDEHWEALKERRRNPNAAHSEPVTEVPMTKNELAEEYR